MKCKCGSEWMIVCPYCHKYAPPSPWISIETHPPKPSMWVLGLTNGGGIYLIRRVNPNDDFTGNKPTDWMVPYYVREDAIFTHWMAVPEMPETYGKKA